MPQQHPLAADEFRVKGEKAVLYGTLGVLGIILLLLIGVSWVMVVGAILLVAFLIRIQQGQFIGRCVKVSEQQLPEVYRVAKTAAQRLNINIPDIFIEYNAMINAFAMGFSKKTVVITSAAVESLTTEELTSIIGHEFTHIKCGHTTWLLFTNASSSFQIPVISFICSYVFLYWNRKSEYTADRGGLVASGNIKTAISALAKLAVGKELFNKLNLQLFFDQKKDIDDDTVAKLAQLLENHPYLVNRVHALTDFYHSCDYQRINAKIGYDLSVQGRTYHLAEGVKLTIFPGIPAEVNHNPNDPGMFGLKNLSNQNWQATLPDGTTHQIAPGRSVRLGNFVKIDFGPGSGEIC